MDLASDNITTIGMNLFKTDEQKEKYYNQLVYMIYGCDPIDVFFIDGNCMNLTKKNIIIID